MKGESALQRKNSKANCSRRNKRDSRLRVVTNPTDHHDTTQIFPAMPLPIKSQIRCPKNASDSLCQQQINRVVKVESPCISSGNKLIPADGKFTNDTMLQSKGCHPTHCLSCFGQTHLFGCHEVANYSSNFQSPVEWQSNSVSTFNNVTVKHFGMTDEVWVFTTNFKPQGTYRRIGHCPRWQCHFSSSFHHQRMASRILSNSSSKLPSTLLSAFSISRRSRSNSLAFFRLSLSQRRYAFSASSHSTTGISFPSTTIVPTIFGLLFALSLLRHLPSPPSAAQILPFTPFNLQHKRNFMVEQAEFPSAGSNQSNRHPANASHGADTTAYKA